MEGTVKVAGAYGEEDDPLKWLREKAFLAFFAFLERNLCLLSCFSREKALLADPLEDEIFALKQLPCRMMEGRSWDSPWLGALP